MKTAVMKTSGLMLTLLAAMALSAGPAAAGPPDHAGPPGKVGKGHKGGGKPAAGGSGKSHSPGASSRGGSDLNVDIFFGDRHRDIIRDYYSSRIGGGSCPPGLAKKRNGCMPPGQAKKWRVGHPLPGDVIYHDLPPDLLHRLGYNDPAYKLIRVGADILKIGVGTGLVVEAVEDLGGIF